MADAQIAQAVQLLDLMLKHFADDGNWTGWTGGRYDNGNGAYCLLLHWDLVPYWAKTLKSGCVSQSLRAIEAPLSLTQRRGEWDSNTRSGWVLRSSTFSSGDRLEVMATGEALLPRPPSEPRLAVAC
jgi:hypothetical protein